MSNQDISFKRTVTAAARELTHVLRKTASENGWTDTALRGIRIHHDGKEFKLHTSESAKHEVWSHEYGTETSRPTATIRRFLNDENRMSEILYRHYVGQDGGH